MEPGPAMILKDMGSKRPMVGPLSASRGKKQPLGGGYTGPPTQPHRPRH